MKSGWLEKMFHKTDADRLEEQEVISVKLLIDHWLGILMDREISTKEKDKALNDKIRSFAKERLRVTTTRDKKGSLQSEVSGISKPGIQGFKFQEIRRRQEAIAEAGRLEEERLLKEQKEEKFQEMQELIAREKELREVEP